MTDNKKGEKAPKTPAQQDSGADDFAVFQDQFNTIPGGVSVSAFASAAGVSEKEAQKRLDAYAAEGRLTASQAMGGPLTYFLSQPLSGDDPKSPEGGPPEMGSIDTREDIDTRPLEEQRATEAEEAKDA